MNDKSYKSHKKPIAIEAYKRSMGVVTTACQKANIDRSTWYDWLDKDKEFADAIKDIEKLQIGVARDRLMEAIFKGDLTTVRWFLERRDPDFRAKAELNINKEETEQALKDLKEYLNAHKPDIIQDKQ